jgi:putative MATE family efflux protein
MEGDPTATTTSPAAAAAAARALGRSELLHTVWSLAWPVIITYAFESLVGLVDTLMVGRLGAASVAAVGVGAQILSGVNVAMMAVGTGTLALVARHWGAREHRQAEDTLAQSILTAFCMAVVIIIPVIVYAREIVLAFAVDAAVADAGERFVRTVMFSVPGAAVLFMIASGMRGAGDTRTPLAIGFTVNVINIIGNYVLIFGKFGFPALGVVGSAAATTIAFTTGAILGIALLASGRLVMHLHTHHILPRPETIRRIMAIGYPAALEQLFMQFGFFLYYRFAARYGTSAVAAYFIGVRILAMSFLPGFGFAAAAGTLVGQNLGARRPELAERSGWAANRLAIYMMSGLGLLIVAFARPMARLFIDDPEVIEDAVMFIQVLGAAQPLMAIDFTLGGALRGAGDTRFPLWSVLIGFYVCRLGFAYTVTEVLDLSLFWLWFAVVGDYIARALLKGLRFRSGRWKTVSV